MQRQMPYDLIVIGAGIQGAGVAQAAAAAGYRVLVLEQAAEAAHWTSSRSSKLIHGGLRYLENGELGLVYESLHERHRLLQNAPQLVQLVPFYIPVYETSPRPPWMIRAGLSLYALLGGLNAATRFRKVPRSEWSQLDGLAQQGLRAVYQYFDGQTDDTALTRAVLASAAELGAEIRLEHRLEGILIDSECVRVTARGPDAAVEVRAQALVNAAGPWVNEVLEHTQPPQMQRPISLIQGAHLVLDAPLEQGIYYIQAADGRAVFVMPWQGKTLLGTTETPFAQSPELTAPTAEETAYLLRLYHQHFLRPGDPMPEVVTEFAGLRVLPEDQHAPFQRPREVVIHRDHPRLLTLYGGKLTVYRATAEKVLRQLKPLLPTREAVADTRRLALPRLHLD